MKLSDLPDIIKMQFLQKILFIMLLVVACAAMCVLSVHFEEKRLREADSQVNTDNDIFARSTAGKQNELIFKPHNQSQFNSTHSGKHISSNVHHSPIISSNSSSYKLHVLSSARLHSTSDNVQQKAGSRQAVWSNSMQARVLANTGVAVLPRISFTSTSALLAVNNTEPFVESEQQQGRPRQRLPEDDPNEPMKEPIGDVPILLLLLLCAGYSKLKVEK